MKPKILIVANKWLDGPSSPVVANHYDMGWSFAKYITDYEYDILFLDESSLVYNSHIDKGILNYIDKTPQLKVIIIVRLGVSELNPSIDCIEHIKNLGIFTCFFWQDSNPWDLQYIQQYNSLIDLNVYWDNPSYNNQLFGFKGDKHLYLWPPVSDSIYFPGKQTMPVSMVGSLRYSKRNEYIQYIKQEIPDFIDRGGQRERNLTIFEYANNIRQSKININFPQHGMGYEQTKSRIMEVLACRSLLLENKNISTRALLEPDKDYVEFDSKEDLKEKIVYYLSHDKEREQIATNGYNTYRQKYTAQIFWNKIIDKING